MAEISVNLVASALSLSLLASSGTNTLQFYGSDPVSVASLQANLDVLGFNAGAPDGHISKASYKAMATFVTQFGQKSSEPINIQVAHIVQSLPDLGTHLSGASILAMQSWLSSWHLYHGPLNGQSSTALIHALNVFQRDVGIPETNQFNGETLATLAHLAVVRQAAVHHWRYTAEPGDQMRELAWAAQIPLKQFESMNTQHNQTLWVGQVVHFSKSTKVLHSLPRPNHEPQRSGPTRKRVAQPRTPTHSHSSRNSSKTTVSPPASTGVLSNIQPIAAFTVYNVPSVSLAALLQSQKSYPHDLINIAVTGQWAVNHSALMRQLGQSGNEIIISGYTGVPLNQLPGWGIRQEIQWSQKAIEETTGNKPVFVSQSEPFNSTARNDMSALNVISQSPDVMAPSPWSSAKMVSLLLAHPDQIVGTNACPTNAAGWQRFFGQLQRHHFVFLSLGQIWAGE
ncbi:MAG: polysaccharide deacetylase family protein [Firmicutes bacterium]|jgi:hypothetical protein|nr:polysaccharide deacetylase family protein [Bacillota bacterium]MCL5015819.1 polysaccharide deacetylase family protein [Bacillota bacterium]HBQ95643.1 hypothetical protein [Sulfobacillus sp.]